MRVDEELYEELMVPALQEGVKQFLIFRCDGGLYAFETEYVQEIVEVEQITRVPMTQPYILGVTNIRGDIVVVVDLKLRYGYGATTLTPRSSIVVVKLMYEEEEVSIGVLVDEVFEVDYIGRESMHEVPPFGGKIARSFMKRIGKYKEENLIVLDIERLFDIDELSVVVER